MTFAVNTFLSFCARPSRFETTLALARAWHLRYMLLRIRNQHWLLRRSRSPPRLAFMMDADV